MEEIKDKLDYLIKVTVNTEGKLTDLSNRLINVGSKLDQKIEELVSRVNELEKNSEFLSADYDIIKQNSASYDKQLEMENLSFKQKIDCLENEVEQEKISRNQDAQYQRSSVNLKILGVPKQEGEDELTDTNNVKTVEVIKKLANAAGISNFYESQIDVCHRNGKSQYAPIYVRFHKKDSRMNFFKQMKKFDTMKNLELMEDEKELKLWRVEKKKVFPDKDWTKEKPRVTVQEPLTNFNGQLLNLARIKARNNKYEYSGYIVKGEVRVIKSENSDFIAIKETKTRYVDCNLHMSSKKEKMLNV